MAVVEREVFTTLQGGRAVAAILVVLFHLTVTIFNTPKYWDEPILWNVFAFGDAGVCFFFVLSGFIILTAHANDISDQSALSRYIWRRLVRIYPVYLVVLLAVLAAYAVVPFLNTQPPSLGTLISSFLLVGPHSNPPLAVSWTLFHEVFFYALFAVAFLSPRWALLIGGAWLVACVSSLFVPYDVPYVLKPINLLFAFGLGVRGVMSHRFRMPILIFWAGVLCFTTFAIEHNYFEILNSDWRAIGYGVSTSLIVLGAVQAEMRGQLSSPKWLNVIGDTSYSLYLVHYPALSVFAKILKRFDVPPFISFVLMLAGCIMAGIVLHYSIERPLLRLMTGAKRPRVPTGPVMPRT